MIRAKNEDNRELVSKKKGIISRKIVMYTLFGALAFVGVLVILALLSQPASAGPILQLEIEGGVLSKEIEPGGTVTWKAPTDNPVVSTNNGDTGSNVNLTIENLPQYWTANILPDSFYLGPDGGTKQSDLTITVPENATHDPTGKTITLHLRDETNNLDKYRSVTVKVLQVYGIELTPDEFSKNSDPAKTVKFFLNISNSGNGKDTVNMTFSGAPPGWNCYFDSDFETVQPFSYAQVIFNCYVPDGELMDSYQITVTATSENSFYFSNKNLQVVVNQTYGVTLEASDSNPDILPDETIDIEITLFNDGNGRDEFNITYSPPPPGWTINGPSSLPKLDPDASTSFTVLIGAAGDALKDDFVTFHINATSGGAPPDTYSQLITAKVLQVFKMDFIGIELAQTMEPDEWGVFTVNVTNTGNGVDTFNIFVDGLPSDWAYPNIDPSSEVELDPDETNTITINVIAAPEALYKNYYFTINTSSVGDPSKTKYKTATASVSEIHGVSVIVSHATKFAEPEQTVSFTIEVTNTGNGKDDISLDDVDVPSGWVTFFSKKTLMDLEHGNTTEVTYFVTPSEDAIVGLNLIRIYGNWSDDFNVSAYDTVTVHIKQVYDVVVNTAKPSHTVAPNSVITYNLSVRNDGTGEDTFELNVSVDPDKLDVLTWVSLEDPSGNWLTSLTLPRDAEGYVILKIRVPTVSDGGEKGSYNITLIAESRGNTSVSSSKTTITQIIGIYDVIMSATTTKGEAAPGHEVIYKLFIQNTGTEDETYDLNATGGHTEWVTYDTVFPWVDLAVGETAIVNVTIGIPSDWEQFGYFETTIVATSRGNSSVKGTTTVNTTITQVYEVDLTSSKTELPAEPDQYAHFEVEIWNKGTAVDEFSIEVPDTDPYKGWVSFNRTLIIVQAGEFELVNVSVLVDEDATVSDAGMVYEINITVTSTEEESSNKTLVLTVDVQQIYGCKIWAYDPDIDGDPDTDIIYSITVSNEGNGEDKIDISADSGWVKTIDEPLVELGPGETSTFNITVHIPNGEPVGDIKINILAISRGDATANETEQLNVGVNPIYDLDIYGSPSSGEITPDTSEDFTIVVENLGTGNDTIKFKIEGVKKDWAKMFKGAIEQYEIFVEAGKTETMILTITVPSDEAKASSIVFTINATSVESKTVVVSDIENIIIDVDQSYDGYIACSDPSKNTEPGEQAEFQLEIHNKGNSDDTFLMAVQNKRSGWTYTFTQPSVGPVPSGSYSITTLRVTPDAEEVQGWYNIRIRATSSEPTIFFEYDQTNLTVDQKYKVELESSGPSSRDVELEGGSTAFYVKVYNRGNGPDSLSLSVDSDQDYWVEMSHSDVSPDPNDYTLIKVWINISSRSEWVTKGEPDPILIKIEVITPGDSTPTEPEETKDILQLTANVKDIYGLFVEAPSLFEEVEIGSSVTFDFTIRNEGTTSQQYKVTTMSYDSTNLSAPTYNPSQSPFPSSPSTGDESLQMTVQPKADGLRGEYLIWVRIVVDQDTKVQYHLNVTVKIKALYGVDFRAQNDEIHKETLVNTFANYTLVIKNIGNDNDRFFLSSTGTFSGLVTFEQDYVNLGPDESAFVRCYIYADQTIIEANNLYPTGIPNTIKVASENETEKTKEIILDTDITEIHSLSLSSPDFEKDVEPGETGNFILYIENTGTTNDKYVHSVVAYDTSALANPTFVPPGPTFPTSAVSPGTSTTLNINVNVLTKDPMVPVGLYNLTIRISIDGYKTIYDDFTFTVEVKQVYLNKLEVEVVDDDRKDADVNEYVNYTLRIKNSGNGPEIFDIVATGKYSALVTPEMDEVTLNQEESITLRIMVFTDENYIDRDDLYGLDLETPIKVTSKSDPDSFDVETTLYTAIKLTTAEVEITITDPNDEGEPGDVMEYIVKIINKGNTEDTFTLSITGPNKDWGEIYDRAGINILDEVTLNEYESAKGNYFIEVMVKVTIPGTGETSAGTTYPVTIVASSTNKEGEQDEKNVNTKVEDYVDLRLDYSGSGSTTKDYDPNKKTPKFSFRLTNNGNKPEAGIEVRVDPEDWTYSPGTIAEEVEAGGTATFSLEFTIPDEETEGEYELQVYLVSSVDSSEESDPVLITVNITKPDLTVEDVTMPDEDTLKRRVDEQVSISATVSNEGHAKAESITVKLYVDGVSKATQTISSIEPGGSRDVNFRWKVEAELLDIEVKVTEIEEVDTGNNVYPPIYLDLRPNLQYEGEQLNFSNSNPDPGEKITLRALIKNTGGDAKGVVVRFTYGTKTIGTDTLDIDYEETGEATFEDWTVPDKPGDSITIKAEIDLEDAIGDREEATKSIKVTEVGGVAGVFTGSGLIGMGIGLIIGALLFLIIGLAIGRRGAAARRGPEGMVGPSFGAFEKEIPEGAEKKAPKAPAPFERSEEEAPPEEEEKAKPKEIARVRCPKCGKVTEVTSTQRPLQIPCECGTTLMLKK